MFDLIVTHPFGEYYKGQRITDQEEIASLMPDRERHFVRVPVLPPEEPPAEEPEKSEDE